MMQSAITAFASEADVNIFIQVGETIQVNCKYVTGIARVLQDFGPRGDTRKHPVLQLPSTLDDVSHLTFGESLYSISASNGGKLVARNSLAADFV